MTLPRYVNRRVHDNGIVSYRWNPPKEFITSGLMKRIELGTDFREVKRLALELNQQIDSVRESNKPKELRHNDTLSKLIDRYYLSNDFSMLREQTKKDYMYLMSVLADSLGDKQYMKITTKDAKHCYEDWVTRGVHFANHICTCASRLYRFAIDMEYATVNPFATVRRKTPTQRKTVWTEDDLRTFLDMCYSKFEYRNIGLIVQMAYEWCQRLGDMRSLTWESLNLIDKKLYLEQSKRRAQVTLPISDNLAEMLTEQKADFGFQPYVCPRPKPTDGLYHPYSMERLSKAGRSIMRQCGLSEDLRLMDLRRTGTTEMVEAGVGIGQIMAVTGHSNPQSVKPYMKNTFTSANYALTTRKMHGISTYKCNTEE